MNDITEANAGEGEGAGSTETKTSTAGTTTTSQGGSSNPPAIGWFPDASAEEIAFATAKGWDQSANPPAAPILKSYMNLQKLFGAHQAGNTVVLPAADADEATLNSFYEKLGRPEAPDKYSAEAFPGLNELHNGSLREQAHKLGISDKQMKGLQEWNKTANEELQNTLVTNVKIEEASQISKLKQEWGSAYDTNLQKAKEASDKLGWTEEQINGMQMTLGFDGLMKLAHRIGSSVGEAAFVRGDSGRGGNTGEMVLTPEEATKEINKLSTNKEFQTAWMDKMHPRHQEMVDRKAQLSKWQVGGK